jgi:hypothetical protein
VAVAVLLVGGAAVAGNLCNLPPTNCATACAGGCASTAPVAHPNVDPCASGGGIDFTGTAYANTCQSGAGCTVSVPPLRFWQHDNYNSANSGCQDRVASQWMSNAELDYGITGATGVWILDQANFQGPSIDGCIDRAQPAVVEFSWLDGPTDGTVNHTSWFLVMASEFDSAFGAYNFDNITGGGGCNAATTQPMPVPAATITTRTAACTGASATRTQFGTSSENAVDNTFFDVGITISNPNPPQYRTAAVTAPLIRGYQVLYREGTEPTSSDPAGWTVAKDPAAPATANHPIIATGTATATVSLPKGAIANNYYIALRIVYQDASLNATADPRVVSLLSSHCGPFYFEGGVTPAVEFGPIQAQRTTQGTKIQWTTLDEQDTLGFQIYRATRQDASAAQVVGGFIAAHGPFVPYNFTDTSVAGETRAYHYFIQEVTSSGAGDRSPWLTVSQDSNGRGRARTRSTRNR